MVIRSTWESEWGESPLGVCVCVGGGNNNVEQGFSSFSDHPPVDLIFSPSLHVHKLGPCDSKALPIPPFTQFLVLQTHFPSIRKQIAGFDSQHHLSYEGLDRLVVWFEYIFFKVLVAEQARAVHAKSIFTVHYKEMFNPCKKTLLVHAMCLQFFFFRVTGMRRRFKMQACIHAQPVRHAGTARVYTSIMQNVVKCKNWAGQHT